MIVMMMGVSGSGKSVVGAALAAARGWPFLEGDALHPPANVAKMAAGHPLDDADRAPWLAAIAAWMAAHASGVVACSALRHAYRDRLRAAADDVRFVLLDVDPATLAHRIASRPGHFMPATLLDSQLATLERPTPSERALALPNTAPVATIVARIDGWLRDVDGRESQA